CDTAIEQSSRTPEKLLDNDGIPRTAQHN
ncbi:unnamed protein product, partial [Rotaria sp. Silwood1]